MLPYFIKSERSQVKDAEPGYHGKDGPLGTRTLYPGNIHADLFIQAGGQAGYPINKDYNGSSQYGFGFSQVRNEAAVGRVVLAGTGNRAHSPDRCCVSHATGDD